MSSFESINKIEALRNRLAAGETTFTLDELKLVLTWADHLNYFRSYEGQGYREEMKRLDGLVKKMTAALTAIRVDKKAPAYLRTIAYLALEN